MDRTHLVHSRLTLLAGILILSWGAYPMGVFARGAEQPTVGSPTNRLSRIQPVRATAGYNSYLNLTCRPYLCIVLFVRLPTSGGGGPAPSQGLAPDAMGAAIRSVTPYVVSDATGRPSSRGDTLSRLPYPMETIVVTGGGFTPRESIVVSLKTPWTTLHVRTVASAAGGFANRGAVTFSTRALLRPACCIPPNAMAADYMVNARGLNGGEHDTLYVWLLRRGR